MPSPEMSRTAASAYVMGHNDRERRRLTAQGAIINPLTEQLLRRAGLTSGMRIVDFGCGVGDISLIAARLVGADGQVTGVDIDGEALSICRQRAREQGFTHVNFEQANVLEFQPKAPVDATVGRHILIHTREPMALFKTAFAALKPGAMAIFQEYDFSVLHPGYPHTPLRDRLGSTFRDFFGRVTRSDMGTQLYHLALEAGFCSVDCRVEYPIGGGAESPYYEWFAESLRSILPRAEALGVICASDVDIDTLADRLRQEAVANGSCIPATMMVGCIARKP